MEIYSPLGDDGVSIMCGHILHHQFCAKKRLSTTFVFYKGFTGIYVLRRHILLTVPNEVANRLRYLFYDGNL